MYLVLFVSLKCPPTSTTDKIIIGSLSGILRVFSPTICSSDPSSVSSDSKQETATRDLLLEVDLGLPILELATGRFLSASPESIYLLVLHPRKVAVYSISGTAGLSDHGFSFNILLMYEHVLQRSAHSVVVGSFGQTAVSSPSTRSSGRDFICVLSLDGTLAFYEQEFFSFSRFLPNFLIPGPFDYLSETDSFVVASSSRSIESYRYQILAIAKDDTEDSRNNNDNKQNKLMIPRSQSGLASSTRGRRVTPDWTVCVGEPIIDLKVIKSTDNTVSRGSYSFSNSYFTANATSVIVLLGERNLFLLRENGSIIFVQKFDFIPVSMAPFIGNGNIMTLIATEFSSLLIYNLNCLKWAAQLPFLPISLKKATISGIRGMIVALSEDGFLSCLYLGTHPSVSPVTIQHHQEGFVGKAIANYEEAEKELQSLRKIIRSFGDDDGALPSKGRQLQQQLPQVFPVSVEIKETPIDSHDDDEGAKRQIGIQVHLSASNEPVKSIKLLVDTPANSCISILDRRRVFDFAKLSNDVMEVIH